jgi:hypothetical protein
MPRALISRAMTRRVSTGGLYVIVLPVDRVQVQRVEGDWLPVHVGGWCGGNSWWQVVGFAGHHVQS